MLSEISPTEKDKLKKIKRPNLQNQRAEEYLPAAEGVGAKELGHRISSGESSLQHRLQLIIVSCLLDIC